MAKKHKCTIYHEVIAEILVDLNRDHANYQELYENYHGERDIQAQHTHKLLVSLCDKIRREIRDR